MGKEGAHRRRQGETGRLTDIARNPDRLPCIARRERFRQFEDAELPADADVLFDVLHADARRALGQVFQKLVGLYDKGAQVRPGRLRQQLRRGRFDLQATAFIIAGNPIDDLIVTHRRRIHNHAHFLSRFIERFPLVHRSPVKQNHQDRGIQRVRAVERELFNVLHELRFLHHHQLPLGHHREPTRGRNHGLRIHVRPVTDGLVEILLPLLQAIVYDRLADEIRVIWLLPHQQIHGLEFLIADIPDQLPCLRFYIDTALRHVLFFSKIFQIYKIILTFASTIGEMLEWLKRHAWKACVPQKGIRSSNLLLSANGKEKWRQASLSAIFLFHWQAPPQAGGDVGGRRPTKSPREGDTFLRNTPARR